MRFLLMCLIFAASSTAGAQTQIVSRAERVANATGLEELLSSVQASNLEGAKAQAQTILSQLRRAGLSESVIEKLTPRVQELMTSVSQAWDAKVAARIYAEGLGEALSDDDLEQAERYYGSPEGKKTYAAINASQQKMRAYILARTNEVLQSEMDSFLSEVKRAAAENQPR